MPFQANSGLNKALEKLKKYDIFSFLFDFFLSKLKRILLLEGNI